MTEEFQIRSTRPEESPVILAIARQVDVFDAEEIATLDELLRAYSGDGPEKCGYCFSSCVQGDQVIGFVCYGPRALTLGTFDLFWICTRPDAQGKGVGSALFRQAERNIGSMGGRLIIIETSTLPCYERAQRFYELHQCRCEAVIQDFYSQGVGMVLYSKRL